MLKPRVRSKSGHRMFDTTYIRPEVVGSMDSLDRPMTTLELGQKKIYPSLLAHNFVHPYYQRRSTAHARQVLPLSSVLW